MSGATGQEGATGQRIHARQWLVLLGSSAGLFLVMLDSTVVGVALPPIDRSLHAGPDGLSWVINAYLVTLAVFVVTAGRLGDLLGRKRVYLVGMALFGLGSLGAGLAPSALALIVARALMGLGASAMLALSLAIVSDAFSQPQRGRALGLWTAVSGAGAAIGPVASGVLLHLGSWRWVFILNLPLVVVGMVLTQAAAKESFDPHGGRRFDPLGLVTLSIALGAVVLGLVESAYWPAGLIAGLVVGGLAMLGVFLVVEHRVAAPLLDLSLFKNPLYLGASAAGFSLAFCFWLLMFLAPQYLQDAVGKSPLVTGVLLLPLAGLMVVLSPPVGRLIPRVGAVKLMALGMVCAAVGLVVVSRATPSGGAWVLLPGFTLVGVAMGLVYPSMVTAAMSALPEEKAGIAAGVVAMTRIGAGAVGIATLGSLFDHLHRARLAAGTPGPDAFAQALGIVALIASAVALAGAVAVVALRQRRRDARQQSPEPVS